MGGKVVLLEKMVKLDKVLVGDNNLMARVVRLARL